MKWTSTATINGTIISGVSEHDLQVACVQWFRYQYPHLKDLLFAIPNGGHRDIRTATRLKAEGVVPGVPDLFLAVPNPNARTWVNGLFIELKVGKNKPTPSQMHIIRKLKEQGYDCAVCYSLDDFMDAIRLHIK